MNEAAAGRSVLSNGSKLGPYVIARPLGAGGMGVVYLARDERLERDVAIKVLPPHLLKEETARRRFRKEALALAKLNHPNIATIYDVGEHEGRDYLVMEYVSGQSLAEKIKVGTLQPREAAALGEEIAKALQEAHDQGVIHRDLKPGNVVLTPKGHAKVLDFGLAKLFAPEDEQSLTASLSQTHGVVGTLLYMSPEQVEGKPVDSRTDLWSLGVILYESLTGVAPFHGVAGMALVRAISTQTPKPLHELRADIPREAERIVARALEKDVSKRYQSASEISADLSSVVTRLSTPALPSSGWELRLSRLSAVAIALAVLIALGLGSWLYVRSERRHWARERAIPEISQLVKADKPLAAFLMLKKAERALPGDPELAKIAAQNTLTTSITSSPSGATIAIQDYLSPDSAWYELGTTPLTKIQIPQGYFRWKVEKTGTGEYISAPFTGSQMNFSFDLEKAALQEQMVWIDGGPWWQYIAFVGQAGPYNLPPFYMDRYEVTNRQYQKFVDQGGYEKKQYWPQTFIQNGHEVSWQQAMSLFRDAAGRPGPSTWTAGHYPEGQADYPVSGVSWYEAAAYAAFAGKSLPAFGQWYKAADPDVESYIVRESNIGLSKLAPAGSFKGLGIYGTDDMAGNVREWVQNDAGQNRKFILGGAWDSQTYLYADPEALSPFDRSPENGFRCVRNTAPLAPAVTAAIPKLERDFSHFKPASDDVFHAYQVLYGYDKTPLNATVEDGTQNSPDWKEQKITFDAAYNNERMTAYLFLPKNVHPPYQTVIFFPSARVLDLRDSRELGDIQFFDYIVQSGRAVLYPIYKGTYERQEKIVFPGASQELTYLTQHYKDVARSLDYLQTRSDIDPNKLAYLGVSMGSAEGVIYATLAQDKLKTAIFLDGGYFLGPPPRGGDQADFAPRLKIPVLMVNGRYDYVFSVDQTQIPLFRMLGTPAEEKQHVVLETGHDVTGKHDELVKAVLGWLDKYLGRVE